MEEKTDSGHGLKARKAKPRVLKDSIIIRCTEAWLRDLDAYIEAQGLHISRSAAVRQIVEKYIKGKKGAA